MTVRLERAFDFDAPPEQVWAFISDPGNRADAISVVDSWEITNDGKTFELAADTADTQG